MRFTLLLLVCLTSRQLLGQIRLQLDAKASLCLTPMG